LWAIHALSVGVPLSLLAFASTYTVIAAQQPEAFTEPLNRTDGVHSTRHRLHDGWPGDIGPVSELARVPVTIPMLVGPVVGLIAKLVLGAVQRSEARRARTPAPSGGERATPLRTAPEPRPGVPAAPPGRPQRFTWNE